jgi:hypothetical protein
MGLRRAAVHRTILVVDVEGFGDRDRTHRHQIAVRDGMYGVLREAFDRVGIPWADCYREDRGDGVLILIPPDVPKSVFTGFLPAGIAAGLRQHNAGNCHGARMRLRAALHAGEVLFDDNGIVSAAVIHAFRLLDDATVKAALARSLGTLAVVASDWFYDEVIRHDLMSRPAHYRQVRVVAKETRTTAWVRLPDEPMIFTAAVGLPVYGRQT